MLKTPDKNDFAGFRDYCLMILMLDTGIRTKEACSIEIKHIDFKNNIINLTPDITKNDLVNIT